MKRSLLLVAIAALFGVTLAVAAPPQIAQALCTSSISPDCPSNAVNMPILLASGIVTAEGTTVVAGASATGAAVAGTAVAATGTQTLAANALAGAGITGIATMATLIWNGITGMTVETETSWAPTPGTGEGCDKLMFGQLLTELALGQACTGIPDRQIWDELYHETFAVEYGQPSVNAARLTTVTTHQGGKPDNGLRDISRDYYVYCEPIGTGYPPEMRGLGSGISFGTNTFTLTCGSGFRVAGFASSQWKNSQDNAIDWYATTLKERDAEPIETNIHGTMRTTLTCKPVGSPAYDVVRAVAVEVLPGDDFEVPTVACGPGETAVGAKVDWQPQGSLDWIPFIPYTEQLDGIVEMPDTYPDCFGLTAAPCSTTIWKVAADGTLESCGGTGQFCPEWAKNPNARSAYVCKFGPYVVDLDVCSMYRAPAIGPLPNTNPDGTPIPFTAAPPNPLPNQITKNPDTGQYELPNGSSIQLPDGNGNPSKDDQGECFPSGWGVLNPVSWVLMPVGCALRAAFMPSPQVLTQASIDIDTKWKTSTLGQWATAIAVPVALTAPSGCEGMAVDMSWIPFANAGTFYFLPACAGDFFEHIAPLFSFFIGGSVVLGGLYRASRMIGAFAGYRGAE